MEAIKAYRVKALNRRIEIEILKKENNETLIGVCTKRLINFKTREIACYNNLYSMETFLLLRDIFNKMIKDNMFSEFICNENKKTVPLKITTYTD